MVELEQKSIIDFLEKVNFQVEEVTKEIIIAEILYFIKEIDFAKIDKTKSQFNDIPEHFRDIEIILSGTNNEYPKIVFDILKDNTVSIRVGFGEGEYLDGQKIDNWNLLHKLRRTLSDLFYNQLKETVYYCNGKVIGNDCSIPYKIDGTEKVFNFSRRFGSCMFWNKKTKETHIYKSWLTT